jgi:hypothetical protein
MMGTMSVLALVTMSCRKPYDYKLQSIDQTSEEQKALILISDPQIFARETLADDRRREAEFLEQLLKESKDIAFEPQLRRELASISLLSRQLGISFDPTRAVTFARSKEISNAEQEIRLAQLRTELLQAQQQLAAVQAEGSTKAPSPPTAPVQVTSPATSQPPTGESSKALLDELKGSIDKVLDHLKSLQGEAKATTIKSSPQETFRDRQAYRNDLRAALGAVNLDDVHDANGNSLFQLQFRATVLPGKHPGQYGAARLTAEAPRLKIADLNDMYRQLLVYVTYQLNFANSANTWAEGRFHYSEIGRATGLYDIIEIYAADDLGKLFECADHNGEPKDVCSLLYLAVPPYGTGYGIYNRFWEGTVTSLKRRLDELESSKKSGKPAPNYEYVEELDKTLKSVCQLIDQTPILEDAMRQHQVYGTNQLITQWLYADTLVTQAILGSRDRDELSQPDSDTRKKLRRRYDILSSLVGKRLSEADHLLTKARQVFGDKQCELMSRATLNVRALQFPDAFGEALVMDYRQTVSTARKVMGKGDLSVEFMAKGDLSVYSAGPLEHAQRVSTMTSAVEALQMTMALSAVIPQYGIGINDSLGFMQHALGKAEALERAPIVVGFSGSHCNRASASPCSAKATPSDASAGGNIPQRNTTVPSGDRYPSDFGWIFGPRVIVDPHEHELRLEQSLATHLVHADISAPAWWPLIAFRVETAWIQNWHGTSGGLDLFQNSEQVRAPYINVRLPRRATDMETLLLEIAKTSTNRHYERVAIAQVVPRSISRCNKQPTTFLVYGPDVWRTTKAYFAGIPHKDIQVLPDMTGVAVQFEMANVQRWSEKAQLTVSSRRGTDYEDIAILGSIDGRTCGDEPVARAFSISSATPVDYCKDEIAILVSLKGSIGDKEIGAKEQIKVFLGSTASNDIVQMSKKSLVVKFKKNTLPSPVDGFLPLTVMNETEIASAKVEVGDGECTKAFAAMSILSTHTVPLGMPNVCGGESESIYISGKKLDVVSSLRLQVPFKDAVRTFIPTSIKVAKPDNVLEATFAFDKLEGKELAGEPRIILRSGGDSPVEVAKTQPVLCQVKQQKEDKSKNMERVQTQ